MEKLTCQDNRKPIYAVLVAVEALISTVNELGAVVEGPLYARLMGSVTLEEFNYLIGLAVESGRIVKRGHVLYRKV